jgi:hypothetical protein
MKALIKAGILADVFAFLDLVSVSAAKAPTLTVTPRGNGPGPANSSIGSILIPSRSVVADFERV